MSINNIAIKNIKGNLNKYIMYYLSNVIVVTIFFIFANYIYNPSVGSGQFSTSAVGEISSNLMYLCEFVIVIFTLIFSVYSISTFLKSREKEFGLLSTFGLTKGQIRRYVMFENIIISIISIITGILFGILFSKLFFMAVSAILNLNSQIPFSISSKAIRITILTFLILLNVISFITSFKIRNNNIAQLLKGERIPKPAPKFSKAIAILSILLIVSGYVIGLISKTNIIYTMIPILLVVTIGTYLLFSQFSVFFTNKLQNAKKVYYRGINLITLSQIIYKLKDNAKVLFITSILSGITLATAISVYSFQKTNLLSTEQNFPNDIGILEQNVNSHKIISPEKLKGILNKYNVNITDKNEIKLITTKDNNKVSKYNFNILSEDSFNKLGKEYNGETLKLKKGEALIYSYNSYGGIKLLKGPLPFENQKTLNLDIGGIVTKYNILDNVEDGIINQNSQMSNTIIINDTTFKELWNKASNKNKNIYYGYNIEDTPKTYNAVTEIKNNITKEGKSFFTEKIVDGSVMMKSFSLVLFLGTFIAIIFFIATGSILYFKMFNELQKDKQDFIALKKMGVTQEEIRTIISIQSLIMFFLPFIIGSLHAVFAVTSVGLLYIKYFILIAGIYLISQIIYYIFAKWMYVKQINGWDI